MIFQKFTELCSKRLLNNYFGQFFPNKFDNIVISMSGGVDSSVCAALYSKYANVNGIYMQNWSRESENASTNDTNVVCYERDWKDVKRVGKYLNIPVERINLEKDYWLDVFEPMLNQYLDGNTPNPDVNCNRFIKFGALRSVLDKKYGKDNYWLVTGHYARILTHKPSMKRHLLRSYYAPKDQSYYLSQIDFTYLDRIIMPMGHLTKPEVRLWAKDHMLPTAEKPDSQGICFVNYSRNGKFKQFLKQYLPDCSGSIVTIDPETRERKVWGRHEGLWSYTIGQKIGISMPQGDPQYQGAWYVSCKDKVRNQLVIVRGGDNAELFKNILLVDDFVALGDYEEVRKKITNTAGSPTNLHMQFRSLQSPIPVSLCSWEGDSRLRLQLAYKQRAMASGQYCTIYSGSRVLGSGKICSVE